MADGERLTELATGTYNDSNLIYQVSGGVSQKISSDDFLNGIKIKVNQDSHGLLVNKVVTTALFANTYVYADKGSAITARPVGFISKVIDDNNFVISTNGLITGLSGLTPGSDVYLGNSGAITTSYSDIGGTEEIVIIGKVINATSVLFNVGNNFSLDKNADTRLNGLDQDLSTTSDVSFNALRLSTTFELQSATSTKYGFIAFTETDLTANITLNLDLNKADRTLTLNGNTTLNDWFDQSVKTTASPSFASLSTTGFIGVGTSTPGFNLTIEDTTANLQLKSDTDTGWSQIFFGDNSSDTIGSFKYSHTDNQLFIGVNGSDKAVITSDGRFGLDTLTPATRLHLDGVMTLDNQSSTPANPSSSSEMRFYIRGGNFIIQYNDSGTVRYKYLDLTGTGVTWTQSTTAPT